MGSGQLNPYSGGNCEDSRQLWGLPDDYTWNVPKHAGDLLTLAEHIHLTTCTVGYAH
jgi:hypothetical protein